MIDFHTHTVFSDGELIPSELAQRAHAAGISALAITDHVDESNVEHVVSGLLKFCRRADEGEGPKIVPGVELTHIPPKAIAPLAEHARSLGARVIIVHGETVIEPVATGTNMAAIEAGVDILAHPGLITEAECRVAGDAGVYLELSGRRGHAFANGHVARTALRTGAKLIFNSDAHAPSDLLSHNIAGTIILGAGLTNEDVDQIFKNAEDLLEKVSA